MKFVKLKLFEMCEMKILKVDKLTIKLKLMTKKVYWQNKNCREFTQWRRGKKKVNMNK